MSDTTTTDAGEQAEAPAPPDPAREELVAALRKDLGDAVIEHVNANGDLWVRVDSKAWRKAGEVLRERHGFEYFCFLSGIDWLANAELVQRYEQVWEPAGADDVSGAIEAEVDARADEHQYLPDRVAGGDTRFQVFARVYNVHTRIGVTLKADLDSTNPSVDSWVPVYRGADWHERETWEMLGFEFAGHPGLRHIYLPVEFEGFPLRKDFPLLSRAVKPWPGLVDKEPVPGEDEEEETPA
jgi:NADH-quinone oxidoreductase subunit C